MLTFDPEIERPTTPPGYPTFNPYNLCGLDREIKHTQGTFRL
jgi:hypothetical protein